MTPALGERLLRRRPLGEAMATIGVAAATSTVAARSLLRRPPGGARRWERSNYRDRSVSLLAGPATVLGLSVGVAVAPSLPPSRRFAAVTGIAGCGALGLYDDLAGDRSRRGLRGHLEALVDGELTTGAVKIAGIGGAGASTAAVFRGLGRDWLPATVTMAGSANLVNLFDLRPGRALKVTSLAALALLASRRSRPVALTVLGVSLAIGPGDLAERTMLGDCGANALGAAVGLGVMAAARPATLLLAALSVVALTLASERVSFGALIAGSPALRRVDDWGRRAPLHPRGGS